MEEFIAKEIAAQRAELDADPGKWSHTVTGTQSIYPFGKTATYFLCLFYAWELCLVQLKIVFCILQMPYIEQLRYRSSSRLQPASFCAKVALYFVSSFCEIKRSCGLLRSSLLFFLSMEGGGGGLKICPVFNIILSISN
jgi:hypothetical protein